MVKLKCWILTSRKKGTNNKFTEVGPYKFSKKSDFGNFNRLKKDNTSQDLKLKKVKC